MRGSEYSSIAFAGEAGSGKTSVARECGLRKGWPVFGAGELFRAWCDAKGISYGATMGQDAIHDAIDQEMLELTQQGGVVVEGRVAGLVTALHRVPGVLKVLLVCAAEKRYERIFLDPTRKYLSLEDATADTDLRERQNLETFTMRYNGESYLDTRFYDLVLDNTHMSLDETVSHVMGFL